MKKLYIRRATPEDVDLVFEWANDKTVRENSFNSEPIPYEEHAKWFGNKLKDSNCLLFIMETDGIPVGQIRLDITDDLAEISYAIGKEYRNKGYGKKIILLAENYIISNTLNITALTAKTKPENGKSKHIFQTLGYKEEYTEYRKDVRQ